MFCLARGDRGIAPLDKLPFTRAWSRHPSSTGQLSQPCVLLVQFARSIGGYSSISLFKHSFRRITESKQPQNVDGKTQYMALGVFVAEIRLLP